MNFGSRVNPQASRASTATVGTRIACVRSARRLIRHSGESRRIAAHLRHGVARSDIPATAEG